MRMPSVRDIVEEMADSAISNTTTKVEGKRSEEQLSVTDVEYPRAELGVEVEVEVDIGHPTTPTWATPPVPGSIWRLEIFLAGEMSTLAPLRLAQPCSSIRLWISSSLPLFLRSRKAPPSPTPSAIG